MMKSLLLLLGALGAASAATTAQVCGAIDGICEITLESLVQVSFYDVNDDIGCQIECSGLDNCNYYSQFVDTYDDTLRKCMLFETCNIVEECEECVTCKYSK